MPTAVIAPRAGYTGRIMSHTRHAATGKRTGGPSSQWAALCGAALSRVTLDAFEPHDARSCQVCRRLVEGGRR